MSGKNSPKLIVVERLNGQNLEDAVKSLNLALQNKNSVLVTAELGETLKYRFVDCDEWKPLPIFIGIERTQPYAYAITEFIDILIKCEKTIMEIKPLEFYAQRYFRQEINFDWHKIRLHLTNSKRTCGCLSQRWEYPEFRKCPTGLCRIGCVKREVWIAPSEVSSIRDKDCIWLSCQQIAQFERKAFRITHEMIVTTSIVLAPFNPAEFSLFSIINYLFPTQFVKRSNKINSIAGVQRSIAKIMRQREEKNKK